MRCSRCKRSEPDVVFTSKTSGYCKDCFRDYRRERYVPVAKRSWERCKNDAAWRARHNAKVCSVCEKQGQDTVFRSLSHKRCSACMTKGLHRCPSHGVSRTARCQKCRYRLIKVRREVAKWKAKRKAQDQIFMVNGDGTCGRCNKNIRIDGKIDRTHTCG